MADISTTIENMNLALIRLKAAARQLDGEKLSTTVQAKIEDIDSHINAIKNTANDLIFSAIMEDRK
jgi:hypothetical protein